MKVILNLNNKSNHSSTVESIDNLAPRNNTDITNNAISIGDKVFVSLNYGYKLGYYLGRTKKGTYQYLELSYGNFCLGNSKYVPIRAEFFLNTLYLDVDTQIQNQLQGYVESFNRGDTSFTFYLEVNRTDV